MRLTLEYGRTGIDVEVPNSATVIEPHHPVALPDTEAALIEALRAPIAARPFRELASGACSIGISVCDITRAQPRREMLHALLTEVPSDSKAEITLFVATGSHRANTPSEIEQMFGAEILQRARVVNHNARDAQSLVTFPDIRDVSPIQLNREWLECNLKVTTGFVEPHFFAGFSGGPKMVAPGLAGIDTILTLHNAPRIAHPAATWGVTLGNPIHDDIRAIAATVEGCFGFDVTLNRARQITGVFTGGLLVEHQQACVLAKEQAMQQVNQMFDVVLTTNSGYPLDQNLYQAVKGISAAARITREGGTIICAAECRDGLPDHGMYASLLNGASSPQQLLKTVTAPGFAMPDQWQAQVQASIQMRATVKIKADGLTDEQIRAAHFEPVSDVSVAVAEALSEYGPHATLCVLPQGPQTIPYL